MFINMNCLGTYPCTRTGKNPNTQVSPNSVAKQMKFLTTLHTFLIRSDVLFN